MQNIPPHDNDERREYILPPLPTHHTETSNPRGIQMNECDAIGALLILMMIMGFIHIFAKECLSLFIGELISTISLFSLGMFGMIIFYIMVKRK